MLLACHLIYCTIAFYNAILSNIIRFVFKQVCISFHELEDVCSVVLSSFSSMSPVLYLQIYSYKY